MSVEAMTWVFKESRSRGTHRLVLLAIADHHGDRGAWPAISTLAKFARVSERTVHRAITAAVEVGELVVDYKAGPHGTNLYILPAVTPCHSVTVPLVTADPDIAMAPEPKEPKVPELGMEGSSSEATDFPAPNGAGYTRSFERFWSVYPLKKDKGNAAKAFKRAMRRATLDEIIAGAERYRDDPERDPTKTKFAEGWLNGDRWLDEASPTGIDAVLAHMGRSG